MAAPLSPSLLIVTAREPDAQALRAILASAGFGIRCAYSGNAALRMFRDGAPDIVLLDQGIPEVPAADLCRALRSDPDAVVSILLLCSSGSPEESGELQACVDDVLALPPRSAEVLARVRMAAERNGLRRQAREDARRIRELEQAREELTQLVARDMKAPLAGLADLLEMADRGSVQHFKSEASQYLNEALDATETLEEMVSFLADVRRMQGGGLAVNRRRCDLAAMMRTLAELLGESATAAGVAVEVKGDPLVIACDERLASRALRHVLRSAILGSERGGSVRISVERDSAGARIQVSVAGKPGEGGEKAAEARRAGAALRTMGLGMTFCRLVMEAHGGAFLVEPGKHPVWTIRFPEATETAVSGGQPAPAEPEEMRQKSRRYLGRGPVMHGMRGGARTGLRTTRYQFTVAVAIMSAIPLLAFGYLVAQGILGNPMRQESILLLSVWSVALVLLGILLLRRHVVEVGRLRRYLELMANGGVPEGGVRTSTEDFLAMAKALGTVMEHADEKVRAMEEQSRSRLQTEQQRVMVETVGAACHHLGQPATVIGVYLDLMKKKEMSPEMQRLIDECQLAAADVSGILHRLQGVARYETEPYLPSLNGDSKRSDERILKI